MSQGRILVIRGGAIGDFILTLPILSALKDRLPGARLELLGYPHVAALAVWGGLADAVHPIEARAMAGFFAQNGRLDPALSEFFEGFHLIISFLFDPDEFFFNNLRAVTSAQILRGIHRPNDSLPEHATLQLLKALEMLAIVDADPQPRLNRVPPSNGNHKYLPPASSAPLRLAIHPGSGSDKKNWSERHWMEILNRIRDQTDWHCRIIGGEAEGDRVERLASNLPSNRVQVHRQRPLIEVAQALQDSAFLIGHDSGISHLSAAVGTPGIALWGPTSAAVWRPYHPDWRIIKNPGGIEAIDPEVVWDAILEQVKTVSAP